MDVVVLERPDGGLRMAPARTAETTGARIHRSGTAGIWSTGQAPSRTEGKFFQFSRIVRPGAAQAGTPGSLPECSASPVPRRGHHHQLSDIAVGGAATRANADRNGPGARS